MMDVRILRTEADYRWALKEADRYFAQEPEPGSPEGDRFELLLMTIEAYEEARYPIAEADPVEVLRFAIESMGRSQAELAELLGSRSRASEILNRRRPLALEQIRRISNAWNIPIACLVRSYALASDESVVEAS